MTMPFIDTARRHHLALKEIFARRPVPGPDHATLRRVLVLCEAAAAAVDDAYCRDKLRLVGEYAAELLAKSDHARWGQDADSGAEFLRQQVLNALELFASRLYSIQALRRAAATKGTLAWTTHSGTARI